MNITQKLCKSVKKYNEGFIGYNNNYAYVLDGATLLKDNIITNTSDAQWYVKTFASHLEKYIQQENVKQAKKGIEMILVLSDGFSAYYDCLRLTNNYKSFFLENYDTNVEELYKQLRLEEQQDKKLNKYPRFKVSGDASIIQLKCN